MLSKKLLSVLVILFGVTVSFGAYAQKIAVRGTVSDANGPVIGAVVLSGSTGVTTDADGSFSISVDPDAVLEVSCLGYLTQQVPVQGRRQILVVLEEDQNILEDAVVVGYGTQKKANLTGAVSVVKADELKDRSALDVGHMLQGTVPGLNITSGSGRPGQAASLNIRGWNSINGGSPLVLIDGVEGDIQYLNPVDVESISVIKDAAAAAIYGARGSAGVILVTTKSGSREKEGRAKVTYSGRFGVTAPTTRTDYETRGYDSVYLNNLFWSTYSPGTKYANYSDADMQELWARRGDVVENPERPWVVITQENGRDVYNYYANTDWWHVLYNDVKPTTNHTISASGATNHVSYLVSGGYTYEQGMFREKPDNYSRVNLRAKISFDVTDWLRIGSNTSYFNSSYFYPGQGGINNNFAKSSGHGLASFPATNPDGSTLYYTKYNGYTIMDGLLMLLAEDNFNEDKVDNLSETVDFTLKPFKGFTIKGDYTYTLKYNRYMNRAVPGHYSQYPNEIKTKDDASPFQDKLSESANTNIYQAYNLYATYENSFNQAHNLKLMAGVNYETRWIKDLGAIGYYLYSTELNDQNLIGADPNDPDGKKRMETSGGQNEYKLAGYFARLPRRTERPLRRLLPLPPRQPLGVLPVRFPGLESLRRAVLLAAAYLVGQLQDPLLLWPAGQPADELLLSGHPHGFHQRQVLLSAGRREPPAGFPVGAGFLRPHLGALHPEQPGRGPGLPGQPPGIQRRRQENTADLRTKGYEISLGWRDSFKLGPDAFHYGLNVVFSDYVSHITRFNNPDKLFAKTYWVGQKYGDIWGYHIDGLFATDEEAKSYAVDQSKVNDAQIFPNGLFAGDMKFADRDGDGAINKGAEKVGDSGDWQIIGNSKPRYNYGVNLNASWFGFDFAVFFQGIGKMDWYPAADARNFWGPFARPYMTFIPKDFLNDCWSEENPNAFFPRPRGYIAMNANRPLGVVNDRYLQNIGYLRLKNLTFGYTLPEKLTKKISISKLRLYFTGENLFYWAPGLHGKYVDPEMAMTGGNMRIYPWQKSYVFGIDITL